MGACDYTQGDESIANHNGFSVAERTRLQKPAGAHSHKTKHHNPRKQTTQGLPLSCCQGDRGSMGAQQNPLAALTSFESCELRTSMVHSASRQYLVKEALAIGKV